MQFSRNDIYKIIIEECINEGALFENTQKAWDLLRNILGDEKFCDRYPEQCAPPEDGRGGDTASMPKPKKKRPTLSSLDTMPFPAEGDVEAQIVSLLGELQPEEAMKIIKNIVSQNYPQYVPANDPDDEGPDPDRPVVLSPGDPRRKTIREIILKILSEYDI